MKGLSLNSRAVLCSHIGQHSSQALININTTAKHCSGTCKILALNMHTHIHIECKYCVQLLAWQNALPSFRHNYLHHSFLPEILAVMVSQLIQSHAAFTFFPPFSLSHFYPPSNPSLSFHPLCSSLNLSIFSSLPPLSPTLSFSPSSIPLSPLSPSLFHFPSIPFLLLHPPPHLPPSTFFLLLSPLASFHHPLFLSPSIFLFFPHYFLLSLIYAGTTVVCQWSLRGRQGWERQPYWRCCPHYGTMHYWCNGRSSTAKC